jgi:hypothetical protein
LSGRTWHVPLSLAKVPALAILLIAVVCGAAELAARTETAARGLLPPSLGSPSRSFEIQLFRLERFVGQHGPPDCVFVGSSLTLTGLDPAIVARAFAAAAGREIRCFNLGVPGLSATDAAALGRVVAEDLRPWLLVYGATVLDFADSSEGPRLADLPWLRYRAGYFSVAGWLADVSRAYRYYLTYRSWLDPEARRLMARGFPSRQDGYYGMPASGMPVGGLTSPLLDRVVTRPVGERHVAALDRLLAIRDDGIELLVLEMPGPVVFSSRLVATAEYRHTIDRIEETIARRGVVFWRTWRELPGDLIPDTGFRDPLHLNTEGAARLSEWLGKALAAAARRGELRPPSAATR